ncbi:MAG TPA: hypothetical protein VFO62_07510 [Candidatus Binatia bacterium]|nr:hypothetical protein [Candidatus Binatia bacterium]
MSGTSTSSIGLTGFGGLLAERQGAEVPVAIPVSGVLFLEIGSAAAITLDSGTLRGIIYTDADGQPLDAERNKAVILFLRAASGATVTIINNSAFESDGVTAIPPDQRFFSPSGDVLLDAGNTTVFFSWAQSLLDWRWFIAKDLYTANSAGDWNPLPLVFRTALDQLARRVPRDAQSTAVTVDPVAPGAFAVMPEMSVVFTPRGTAVWIDVHALLAYMPTASGDAIFVDTRLTVGGVAVAGTLESHGFVSDTAAGLTPGFLVLPYSLGRVKITGLTAGAPVTIALEWQQAADTAGTVVAVGTSRRLVVEDVPWS